MFWQRSRFVSSAKRFGPSEGNIIDLCPGLERAFCFQSPCLLPWLSALRNVRLGLDQVLQVLAVEPAGVGQVRAQQGQLLFDGQVFVGLQARDATMRFARKNVEVTEEMVALIAAQRNFQANAKALDAESKMSQAIMQAF